jgi:hypothetical protein
MDRYHSVEVEMSSHCGSSHLDRSIGRVVVHIPGTDVEFEDEKTKAYIFSYEDRGR